MMTVVQGSLLTQSLDGDELLELILETAKVKGGLEQLQLNQVDINHQNSRGWCLLFEASAMLSTNVLNEVIDSGVLINIKDSKGRNALFWALYTGNSKCAALLIRKGIDYCSYIMKDISSLQYSIFKNNFEVFQLLCEFMDINDCDLKGSTPLMCTAFYDRDEMMEYLLKKGADTQPIDHDGQNLLDYAVSGNSMKCIKSLKRLYILDDVLYKKTKD